MSTLALASADAAIAAEPRAKPSLFQRLLDAREKQALRRVDAFLAAQGDQRLQDLGYNAADIEAIRQGRPMWPSR